MTYCVHCGNYHDPVCKSKPVPTIDGARYNPVRTERKYRLENDLKYLQLKAGRLHARTSLSHRFRQLNQPGGMFNLSGSTFSPGVKPWAILFVVLALSIGIGAWAAQPSNGLFHSFPNLKSGYSGVNDPDTLLWTATSLNASGSSLIPPAYNGFLASGCSGCYFGGVDMLILSPNSTNTAIALTKAPVDFSQASAKALDLNFTFGMGSGTVPYLGFFGIYLSTNGTVPTRGVGINYPNSGYYPGNDPSVVFESTIACITRSGCSTNTNKGWDETIYFQKAIGVTTGSNKFTQTIGSEDTAAECNGTGSCYMSLSSGVGVGNVSIAPALHQVYTETILNYSSVNTSGKCNDGTAPFISYPPVIVQGPGCSWAIMGGSGGLDTPLYGHTAGTTQIFPTRSFGTLQLYVGYYVTAGFGANVGFGIDEGNTSNGHYLSNDICIYQLIPAGSTSIPALDTSGFFGSLIKSLLAIGVYILASILSFASYIWNIIQAVFAIIMNILAPALATLVTIITGVIKSVLDAIGNALGLGNVGTNLFTFFGDVGSFFTTFFGNAIAQVSSFITFLNNGYSTISASFNTYWTDLTNWTSGIKDFLSGLWIIANQITWLSFSFMFSGWLLYGAKKFSDSVGEGMEWFNLTRQWVLLGVAITIFLLTFLITHVITPSMHAIMATGEAKKTAEPDIEIGGTGVG